MTYEDYLDEVTTLIVEKYAIADAAAIALVMQAQDSEFFVPHDLDESLRNVERAHQDARTIYQAAQKKPL